MKREMIVAYGKYDREIGQRGDMPWGRALPADLAHFRALTIGKSIIMGRRTFDSLPGSLPDRQNIVVTSRPLDADVTIVKNLDEAYAAAESQPIVIGGAMLYQAALPHTDIMYATEIDAHFPDADTQFPTVGKEWQEVERTHRASDDHNMWDIDFVTYSRH